MAQCKTCGAPVNLAPDGDPRYERPYRDRKNEIEINQMRPVFAPHGTIDADPKEGWLTIHYDDPADAQRAFNALCAAPPARTFDHVSKEWAATTNQEHKRKEAK